MTLFFLHDLSFSFLKVFFFFAVDHDAYTRPLPTILHRFFFSVVCVRVVLAAVGFSFGKYNSLLLFAGLFFFYLYFASFFGLCTVLGFVRCLACAAVGFFFEFRLPVCTSLCNVSLGGNIHTHTHTQVALLKALLVDEQIHSSFFFFVIGYLSFKKAKEDECGG